jgi:hypothetical protein
MTNSVVSEMRCLVVVAVAIVLGGCIDEPATSSSATVASASASQGLHTLSFRTRRSSTSTTTTTPPKISGTPITTVVAGSVYSFTPSATNTSGHTLTFSILNMPAWAAFSSSTGQLSGTPAASNVGSYANIVIRVSNGSATTSLSPFSITVTQPGGTAALSWTAPTSNADGSALTDLAGYHIYYGTSATALSQVADIANSAATSYVVGNLAAGTYYFAVQAYNSSGTDSAMSAVANTTI